MSNLVLRPFSIGASPLGVESTQRLLSKNNEDARRKIQIKPPKETKLGVTQAVFDP